MAKRLLLIGGGHSHLEVIRRFGRNPEPGVDVTLLSPETRTAYSGMLPGHVAGHYRYDECHVDLDALCRQAGVIRIEGAAVRLDPARRLVHCGAAGEQHFDILSIDAGSTPLLAAIPGAQCHGIAAKPVSSFLARWTELRAAALTAAGRLRIVVVGAGAAGVEVTLAMQHWLHNHGGEAQFTVLGDGPTLLAGHARGAQRRFAGILKTRGIGLRLNTPVQQAQQGALLLHGGELLPADETVWMTGAAAPPWPGNNGLQTDGAGFVAVDSHLQSLSHPGIFAAGDIATMVATPRPKSGVHAVRQGPPLAHNLRRALRGEPLQPYHPQHRALALISTGDRHAVASWGALSCSGAWVWHWKNHLDQAFMRRYSTPQR